MANYHLEIKIISRKQGGSLSARVNYITGERTHDTISGNVYYHKRTDIALHKIYIPDNAPKEFTDLATLISTMDLAERRKDARTAREFIGSLPNELPFEAQVSIIEDFVKTNFVDNGYCVIAGIHKGTNKDDHKRDNPHVHLLVSTRQADHAGFAQKKDRSLDRREMANIWRQSWADIQNRAYERAGLTERVSHLSLEVLRGYGPQRDYVPFWELNRQRAVEKAREKVLQREQAIPDRSR